MNFDAIPGTPEWTITFAVLCLIGGGLGSVAIFLAGAFLDRRR